MKSADAQIAGADREPDKRTCHHATTFKIESAPCRLNASAPLIACSHHTARSKHCSIEPISGKSFSLFNFPLQLPGSVSPRMAAMIDGPLAVNQRNRDASMIDDGAARCVKWITLDS
jgi:hypothetical protein